MRAYGLFLNQQDLPAGDPAVGLAMLAGTTAMGGAMGAHMTASIGGLHPTSPL